MDEIRVNLQFVRGEYIRGVRLYLRKSRLAGPLDLILLAVILAITAVLIWLKGMTVVNTALVVLLAMAAGMGFYAYLVRPGYQFDHTPQCRESSAYTFTKEDIGLQNSSVAGVFTWAFTQFWNTEEFYFLLQDKQNYTMLPKRIFGGPEEWARFEALVVEAVPNIKYKDYR